MTPLLFHFVSSACVCPFDGQNALSFEIAALTLVPFFFPSVGQLIDYNFLYRSPSPSMKKCVHCSIADSEGFFSPSFHEYTSSVPICAAVIFVDMTLALHFKYCSVHSFSFVEIDLSVGIVIYKAGVSHPIPTPIYSFHVLPQLMYFNLVISCYSFLC